MKQEEITKIKKEYYTDNIIDKMLSTIYYPAEKNIKNGNVYRSVSILNNKKGKNKVAFRGLTFSNRGYFKKVFFNWQHPSMYLENDSNFYCSVARLEQLPLFPFKDRAKVTKPFYEHDYVKYIKFFDLYFDFDIYEKSELKKGVTTNKLISQRIKDFLHQIEKLIHIIKQYNLKSEISFSGNRGFKVIIINESYKYHTAKNLVSKIARKINLKYCDTVGIFIPSKLMKMTYSLVFSDNNKPKIVYPLKLANYKTIFSILLNDENFNYFRYDNTLKYNLPDNPYFLESTKTNYSLRKFIGDYALK